jgi:esterase/lipase
MKIFSKIGAFILLFVLVYFAGPKPTEKLEEYSLPPVSKDLLQIEKELNAKENLSKLKPGNQAQILWADSVPQKTNYVILYLHGFGASSYEGKPIHEQIAKKYHANLFLSRLAFQGIDTSNAMYYLTMNNLWQSAVESYAMARQLGDSVIVMSTSTGSTLGLMLAARYPEIKAMINYSPNIRLKDPLAFLLDNNWGLQIARLVIGSDSFNYQLDAEFGKYWYCAYRLESVVQLEHLLETQMVEATFNKVHQPVLNLYYYKDEAHQDQMVNVQKIKWMHELLATPPSLKRIVNIENAGDHILANPIRSKAVEKVYNETADFCEQILGLKAF